MKLIEKIKSPRQVFSKNKIKKYEVMSLMANTDHIDRKLKQAQDEGWEICGDILLKNKDGWVGNTFFHIPMRRLI